jgi:hypothetical protein
VNHSDRAASPYALTIRPLTAADRGSLAELPERVSPQSAATRHPTMSAHARSRPTAFARGSAQGPLLAGGKFANRSAARMLVGN